MRGEDAESRRVRQVAARAIRRLNVFEYVILAAAAGLALLAGALVAVVLGTTLDLPFRPTWVEASLALFVIPATFAYLRDRRLAGRDAEDQGESGEAAAEPEPGP